MTDIKTIEGTFTGGKGNYTIVVGRWKTSWRSNVKIRFAQVWIALARWTATR